MFLKTSPLVVALVLLIPTEPTALPPTAVSLGSSDDTGSIQGVFWRKYTGSASQETDLSQQIVANGSVLVTDAEITRLLGETTTPGSEYPNAGSFRITRLPAKEDLLVFFYDSTNPGFLQLEELRLAPNESKELQPNNPNALVTRLMTATDLLGPLRKLVNQNLERAQQAEDTELAERMSAHLDKLNLPPLPEEPYAPPSQEGGMSGKTLGIIGAAAGGAGFAIASATGGSDTPPVITTTSSTTTTVPSSGTAWNCDLTGISADRRWFNTQRNVAEGNEVRLRSWGTVTVDANGTRATPDGSGQGMADSSAVMPGAPLHSLICAWDHNGATRFYVGSETTVEVTETGAIYCSVNEQPDVDASFTDNSGYWTIEVCFRMPWS
jgi:hypothetical protein